MRTQDKKLPALNDLDLMPFGKYKGIPMQDVPAKYLLWLWGEGCTNVEVSNYIHNSMEALEEEAGEIYDYYN